MKITGIRSDRIIGGNEHITGNEPIVLVAESEVVALKSALLRYARLLSEIDLGSDGAVGSVAGIVQGIRISANAVDLFVDGGVDDEESV